MASQSSIPTLDIPAGPGDHAQGPANAPVTLVEYGDYECGDCGQAWPIVKLVQKQMGKRLRFVFRNFPLTDAHPNAANAAEAAEAAGAQGKFWKMYDALFDNQTALDVPSLIAHAARIGVDSVKIAAELAAHTQAPRVREDVTGGIRSGVTGTPTFFINGLRYDGPWYYPDLLAALEAALVVAGERSR